MTDSLDSTILNRSLHGTMFADKLRIFSSIDSTNTYAMQQGAEGAPHGSVYLAEEQTAGRGRGAHGWHSEPQAGLYLSVLIRPRMAATHALWLSLATGLAVQRAVADVTGFSADIRWPNDLLLDGRKFGGILTEMTAEATRVRFAVIGIGINVNHRELPAELRGIATSLRIESGRICQRTDLAVALLENMDAAIRELMNPEAFPATTQNILTRIERQSTWIRGKCVHVDESGGYTGVTAGLDAQGFLLVQTSNGLRTVLSGGVREIAAQVEDACC